MRKCLRMQENVKPTNNNVRTHNAQKGQRFYLYVLGKESVNKNTLSSWLK